MFFKFVLGIYGSDWVKLVTDPIKIIILIINEGMGCYNDLLGI